MDNPQYVLNEINKGIKMGMDSISTITEKVDDNNFRDDLMFQYNKYNDILNKVNSKLQDYNDLPKELPTMQKTMGWFSIQANTLTDKSNSKIAEMLMQGTNMGIIEGVKLLNRNPELEGDIKEILSEFVDFQENNIQKLKTYL